MIEDIIFSKIYKNKKFLSKLNEDKNDIQNNELLDLIKKISKESNAYMTVYHSGRTELDIYQINPFTIKNVISIEKIQQAYPNISNIIYIPLYKSALKNAEKVLFMYTTCSQYNINLQTGAINSDEIIFYTRYNKDFTINDGALLMAIGDKFLNATPLKFNGTDANLYNLNNFVAKKLQKALYKDDYLPQMDDDLNNDFELSKTKIMSDKEIKKQKKEQVSLWTYDVETTNDTSPKETPSMHIKTFKSDGGNRALPFIYTSEVITDNRARTFRDTCRMARNNLHGMLEKLEGFDYKKYIKRSKVNIDLDKKDIQGDISDKKMNKIKNTDLFEPNEEAASTQDAGIVRRILIKLVRAYGNAIENAEYGEFNTNIDGSHGLNYNMHLYLPEILCPLAIIKSPEQCKWNKPIEGDTSIKDGLTEFKKHLGRPNAINFEENSYISYPDASNFPLADSMIIVDDQRIYVSTKGGANGKGASASMRSLREFVFDNKGNETNLAKSLSQDKRYANEYMVFKELIKGYKRLLNWNIINQYTGCSQIFELKKWLQIHKTDMTHIVMTVLQAASFDFIQMNAKASSTNDDFHFDYTVQYPAIFRGDVDIEIDDNRSTIKFHIV